MVMTQCEHCKEEVEVNMFYHDSRITSITASIFHHQYYTAMVEGRGEALRKLPDMPECFFVVCKPSFSVTTGSKTLHKFSATLPKSPEIIALSIAI